MVIGGSAGDDELYGGVGDELIWGGRGDDRLHGGDGDATLIGGPGADALYGGRGIDTVDYSSAANGVNISLGTAVTTRSNSDGDEHRGDDFSSIENVVGTKFNDRLAGDAGDNLLEGRHGNDWIFGGGAQDTLFGGVGHDLLFGGAGDDLLFGGASADYIDGWPRLGHGVLCRRGGRGDCEPGRYNGQAGPGHDRDGRERQGVGRR